MAALIEIKNIYQSFRSGFWLKPAHILKGISFEIPAGSIFGFLGPNGSGKTTLIQLMAGLRKPTSGEIRIDGQLANSDNAKALIGYLPERPYFYDHLTGEQFLNFCGRISKLSSLEIKLKTTEVLQDVGIEHARKLELRKYSKGMLQRIGIAQALIHSPRFLILDEPMSGLDPIGRIEMRELILALGRQKRTVFFSSHVVPDVERICDQVALIADGVLVESGPIGQFLAKGSIKTEIAFRNLIDPSVVNNVKELEKIPDGYRCTVTSQEESEQAVSDILRLGGRLLWVTPIRQSLESHFDFRKLKKDLHEST